MAMRFQSTLPARGATFQINEDARHNGISIHAPRKGSDPTRQRGQNDTCHFNPRSPQGERRPCCCPNSPSIREFQSTLPARGATLTSWITWTWKRISIHAPRKGSDPCCCPNSPSIREFQSTLPARGATKLQACICILYKFQSTLPARGATASGGVVLCDQVFQSTLPARGATLHLLFSNLRQNISIHAPRKGSDDKSLA